ncbi:MAG: tyrosine protein phosphatase [Hyphomicrobiaceae bacterium]|nr:tyrosine protein phosphatase [Hyphomicrobiaceae bacterium]
MLIAERHALNICPLRSMPRVVEETGARHLISLVPERFAPKTPPTVDPAQHLQIPIEERISRERAGNVPVVLAMARLLAFARTWDRRSVVVVHCFSGISRSTAAALAMLAALRPDDPADLLAGELRKASVTAFPSASLIALADEMLGRAGDLRSAVDRIGLGVRAAEGRPFGLDVEATVRRTSIEPE